VMEWIPRWPTSRGHFFMVVVAVVVGVGGGLGAVALRHMIDFFQGLFFGSGQELLPIAREVSWSWRLVAPALGGLLVGPLVYFAAREARGHGVPEVMESLLVRGGVIRPRVVVVKALASAMTIGSGGSVGREGPIVQIGSALGSTIGQALRVSTSQSRTLVGCGAAAGIAAAFNAPIAGALFAVEILLGDFGVPQFTPIVISSVVATVVSRYFVGDHPAFIAPTYELVRPLELIPYMVVGVVASVVALAFIATLYKAEEIADRVPIPNYLKASIGGLMVGAIGIWLPEVFGVGYTTITHALAGQLPIALVGGLIFAKMLATSITLASGGSGGVFAPSLFLGAVTGGFFGTLIHQWFPEQTATSGAYALVTMGAVVGAATHAPITAIIMIFELTGDYRIIPPLMTACVISSLLATWLNRDSIYTKKLRLRGLDPFRERDMNVLKAIRVGEVMDRHPEIIRASDRFAQVVESVVHSKHTEFFVVGPDARFMGSVSLSQLRRLIFDQDALEPIAVAADLVDMTRPTVREDDDLDLVMRLFSDRDLEEIAVVHSTDAGKLVGSIHRSDVIHARNRQLLNRDLAGSLSSTVSLVGKVKQVEIGDGYVVQEVISPREFFGRTLRHLDLRARMGVQVIFIRSQRNGPGASWRVPSPDDRIGEGDVLIVAGPKQAADELSEM